VGNSRGRGKGLKKLKIQDKGENTHITINILTFVIKKKKKQIPDFGHSIVLVHE